MTFFNDYKKRPPTKHGYYYVLVKTGNVKFRRIDYCLITEDKRLVWARISKGERILYCAPVEWPTVPKGFEILI